MLPKTGKTGLKVLQVKVVYSIELWVFIVISARHRPVALVEGNGFLREMFVDMEITDNANCIFKPKNNAIILIQVVYKELLDSSL